MLGTVYRATWLAGKLASFSTATAPSTTASAPTRRIGKIKQVAEVSMRRQPRRADPGLAQDWSKTGEAESKEAQRRAGSSSRLSVDGPRGMSLHAATAVKARQRSALERLLCYVLRPPVVPARVRWRDDGMVELSLSRPWSNGTRCFLFTPLAFIGRLVPLIPAPGTHDVRYHGVFAPNARWRREVVAMAPCRTAPSDSSSSCDHGGGSAETEAGTGPRAGRKSRRIPWSELLKRTFGLELLRCARCGGKRQILAVITDLASGPIHSEASGPSSGAAVPTTAAGSASSAKWTSAEGAMRVALHVPGRTRGPRPSPSVVRNTEERLLWAGLLETSV